jgi:hypothetical protein
MACAIDSGVIFFARIASSGAVSQSARLFRFRGAFSVDAARAKASPALKPKGDNARTNLAWCVFAH